MDNFEKICPSSQSANQGTDTSSAVINDDTNGNLSGGYLQKYFNGAGLLAQGTSYCLLICWEVDNFKGDQMFYTGNGGGISRRQQSLKGEL